MGDRSDDASREMVGPALYRVLRLWSNRPSVRQMATSSAKLARIFVVQAVEPGPEMGPPEVRDREVTVGTVAERLQIDPSTASRMVSEAIGDGYVARVASQADGRRVILRLTDSGRELADMARRHQQDTFAEALADWPEADRDEFARLLVKFLTSIAPPTTP